MDGHKPPTPTAKTFNCLKCGAPIRLRGLLQTTSVVCGACGSVIDISDDENLRIISTFASKRKVEPAIPLGSRGTLPDGTFEVIGFMQRVISVDGVEYRWREYLLFNPFKGFRFLSEYNGHWSYIKTTLYRPFQRGDGGFNFKGTAFRHFQTSQAKVDYVVGEFYWQVKAGEVCTVKDFVAPPQILSMEQTDNEITWSLGDYIESDALRKAFKLQTGLPARIGVGINQPSPAGNRVGRVLRWTAIFIGIAFLMQLGTLVLSQNKLVYQNSFFFNTREAEKSQVTDIFELSGRPTNVMVSTRADIDNNWLYMNMALINDATGTAYDFGREIEYYYGRDSDGNWTEGSKSDEVILPRIPAGRYYLRLEPEGTAPASYSIRVYRDVPRWWPFFITVGVLLLMPLTVVWKDRKFEYERWSESDHPMKGLADLHVGGDDE
jgi:Domain of unknown function (DUF4178)